MEIRIKSAEQLSLIYPGRVCALNCNPNRQLFTVIYTGAMYTDQVKEVVRKAKAQWGNGWQHLSENMRQAYIARECLGLFLGQDESCRTPTVFAKLVTVAELALQKSDEES